MNKKTKNDERTYTFEIHPTKQYLWVVGLATLIFFGLLFFFLTVRPFTKPYAVFNLLLPFLIVIVAARPFLASVFRRATFVFSHKTMKLHVAKTKFASAIDLTLAADEVKYRYKFLKKRHFLTLYFGTKSTSYVLHPDEEQFADFMEELRKKCTAVQ